MKNDSMIIAGTIKLTQAAGSVFLKNKKQLSADVALFLENYIVMVQNFKIKISNTHHGI
jgi:plasmid maintenance system antidote protein VapI